VPNMKGLEAALEVGANEVAVFVAASDAFSLANTGVNVKESFERVEPVCRAARAAGVRVRGYVSTVIACPMSGPVSPDAVAYCAARLVEADCDGGVSLGDTTGVGTPLLTQRMIDAVQRHVGTSVDIALHAHDTYGMAVANILAALQLGVHTFDASVAGLGGCPFAPGATGNVATEDLQYFFAGLGTFALVAEVGGMVGRK
jgi:hydroxymethylglutaryl-CoA lyase